MYPITNEVKALFESGYRKVLRITGTDKNGAAISITDNDVSADSFQIDRYSCNGEKLEVGTAIAAQLSFTLENGNGLYNSIVFEGAELFAEVGIADWTQSSPTVTYVPCGYFTPDNQPRRLSTISITALDRMTLFDAVVDAADLTFPTTVAGLVGQVCTLCGVTLAQSISGLVNAGVSVAEMPTAQGDVTYRNLIQWCAGIMGTNAWFDWAGQLRFSWYANATGYVSTMDNRYNSDMYEDDLTVSGVEYTNDSGIVIVEGTDDYAIDLTGNAIARPLVATVLPALNTALNGFTYRPFTAATVNAPYLWPMDVVTFTDRDGNNHTSVLTNVAFGLNGTTAMESKGMTYAINKLAQPKGFTREQAQLVSQAMEHVEQDIDDSLTQQEIFNRLTDNGAAQGLVLYNGQLYMNATYMRSGTIDGDSVNAKKFIVVDENNNVIASFDSSITLGKSTDTQVELDYNSFGIKGQSGSVFLKLGDARDEQGRATVQDTYVGDGNNTNFLLNATPTTINSVKVDDVTVSNWSLSNNIVVMTTAPTKGAVVVITYVTEQPVYNYTLGTRDPNYGIGIWSVAEGYYVGASGFASHAEGQATNAPGYISHAEGHYSTADGYAAHAEGYNTKASGNRSHAEGWETEASGTNSHTEGNSTEASGECGHAEGGDTVASGNYSHAEGRGTIASATAQHVVGRYNVGDNLKLEIVGNGSNDNNRSNARTLDENGNEWIAGALSVGNAATTRTNLGITPANIRAFGAGSVGAITDANDTSLYGSRFFQANACANLPTNGSGVYYQVEFFGACQMAFRYSSTGITETWGRYYTNNQWYPWVRIDKVTGVKGNAESTYRTGDVNLTPANIGAHPARTNLVVTNNTDYSGDTMVSKPVVQIVDTNNFIRHQLFGMYNSNGSFYTYLAARKPNGSSAVTNQLGIGFDANGNGTYFIAYPAAFRDAIGATNTRVKGAAESSYRTGDVNLTPANIGAAQRIQMYNSNYSTWADVYAALTALDAYAPCTIYLDTAVSAIVSDGKITSAVLFGTVVTNKSTTIRLMVRNNTGNIMYNISITDASATNRTTTVYMFSGTAV